MYAVLHCITLSNEEIFPIGRILTFFFFYNVKISLIGRALTSGRCPRSVGNVLKKDLVTKFKQMYWLLV